MPVLFVAYVEVRARLRPKVEVGHDVYKKTGASKYLTNAEECSIIQKLTRDRAVVSSSGS